MLRIKLALVLQAAAVVLMPSASQVRAVNLNRFYNLTKAEFVALDNEVSSFYEMSYSDMDSHHLDYDQLLFKALRAYKHTSVINHFDYRYGDVKIMEESRGSRTNDSLCLEQLDALSRIVESKASNSSYTSLPLSVVNFLEAFGRTEPGLLSGNYIWHGSVPSCTRARIPASSLATTQAKGQQPPTSTTVQGRYCIGHLKAKSWPVSDIYFEDRISIKVGLCLPDSCHSRIFVENERVRQQVNALANFHLSEPFNQPERYNITYLYCFVDDDAPKRNWNFGAKLFVVSLAAWLLLVIYTNWRYYQRKQALRELHDAVDIKMIFNHQKTTSHCPNTSDGAGDVDSKLESNTGKLDLPCGSTGSPGSNRPSPCPSDVEDDSSEFTIALKPFVAAKTKSSQHEKEKQQKQQKQQAADGFDIYTAFSFESNLNYLLQMRAPAEGATGSGNRGEQVSLVMTKQSRKSSSSSSPRSRKISASNEALIKELQAQAASGTGHDNQAQHRTSQHDETLPTPGVKPRVNIDIFDGIKVISTANIVFSHTLYILFEFAQDMKFLDERMMDFTMAVALNGFQVVGLFYVITGIILTYLSFTRAKAKQMFTPSFWLLIVIGRYLRLLPTYALVFWFSKHVSQYLGTGANFMDHRTDLENIRGYCSIDSWWNVFTISASDTKAPYGCIPQAWYLSNDIRSLLVLPIYLIILAKNRTAGYAAIAATFFYSGYNMFQFLSSSPFDFHEVLRWNAHVPSIMSDRLNAIYTNLSLRISTYLLGVTVGHLLYRYEMREIKQWPSWLRNYGYKVSFGVGSIFFFIGIFFSHPLIKRFWPPIEQIDESLIILLIISTKSIMEIIICVLILLTVTGNAYSWITGILASRPAKVLSNISYAVYLIHMELMFFIPAAKLFTSYFYLHAYSSFFILVANVIAFGIHLLYEMPINNVIRHAQKRVSKWIQVK